MKRPRCRVSLTQVVVVIALSTDGTGATSKPGPREAQSGSGGGPSVTIVDFPFRLGEPPRAYLSFALSEEYIDGFVLADDETTSEFRSSLAVGLRYEDRRPRSRASLATSLAANYDTKSRIKHFAYGNLNASYEYRWPRLTLSVTDSFIRGDEPSQAGDITIRRVRSPFLRNTLSPTLAWQVSARTDGSLGYSHTLVYNDEPQFGNSTSHVVTAVINHALGPFDRGHAAYHFRDTTTNLDLDSAEHGGNVGLSHVFGPKTTGFLGFAGSRVGPRDAARPGRLSGNASAGLSRQLGDQLGLTLAGGATGVWFDDGSRRVLPYWQANLTGALPIFRTQQTSINLAGDQNVTDTATEVDNRGLVFRQTATVTLNHTFSRLARAALSGGYHRTTSLEPAGPATGDGILRAANGFAGGATFSLSLPLSRSASLTTSYRYSQRPGGVRESTVFVALSEGFALF